MNAPERIYIELEPYDFPGYSPCWVWHSAEGLVTSDEPLVEFIRADLYDAQAAEIADLRRQLAEAREVKPQEVKPLEWRNAGGNWQWGNGLFNYEVVNMHGSGSFWWRRALSGTLYQPENDHTEAAAKAAAQADYEARILSALKGAAK